MAIIPLEGRGDGTAVLPRANGYTARTKTDRNVTISPLAPEPDTARTSRALHSRHRPARLRPPEPAFCGDAYRQRLFNLAYPSKFLD
jgi:hypothetical protein